MSCKESTGITGSMTRRRSRPQVVPCLREVPHCVVVPAPLIFVFYHVHLSFCNDVHRATRRSRAACDCLRVMKWKLRALAL